MSRNIIIVFLLLIIAGLGSVIYFKPKTFTPPFCSVTNLTASATPDAGAGNVYITFQITNTSTKTCLVRGDQFIQVVYDQNQVKNLNIIDAGLPSINTFTLEPKSSLYALLHYPNGPQCNGPFSPVSTTFTYQISPTETLTFPPFSPTQAFSIPSCETVSELTDVAVSNLTNVAPHQ